MKKLITILTASITIIASIFGVAIKYIQFRDEIKSLKSENTEYSEQVIESNKIVQVHKDSIFGLVQDTKECITTRKVLAEAIKEDHKTINQIRENYG